MKTLAALRLTLVAAVWLFLAAPCGAPTAHAGENRILGIITSTGTSVSNFTTAVPFFIPPGAKLTLCCDAAARLLTDQLTVANSGATKGVLVPACSSSAPTLFPTSVGSSRGVIGTPSQQSAGIAMISVTGTVNCDVFQRLGTE